MLATRPGGLAVLALPLAGCATGPDAPPTQAEVGVYPAKGQSPDQQVRDTQQCAAWAQQQTGYNPGQSTAAGAGIGAAIGALGGAAAGAAIGAITGNAGTGAAVGAVAGGAGGGVIGGSHQYEASRQGDDEAFAACMGGRGCSVSS
jgi:Glycine zipper